MNLIYQNGIIPTINKPTRVTEKLQQQLIISLITVLQKILQVRCFRSFSNLHFFFFQQTYLQKMMLSVIIKELLMKKKLKIFFKISINMSGIPLKLIRMQMKLTVISYLHYEEFMIKTKDLGSPWKTKGIKKSSKKKECLYSKSF